MSVKILQAKNNFLDKLSIALDKEQEISSVLRPSHKQKTDETRKEILERLAQDLLNPQPASNPPKHNEPIRIEFENYMDKLVRRVKDKHKHQENIEKLEQLIETTRRLELVNISTATPPKKIRPKKSIHIKFKDGAIRPTHQVSLSNLSLYHWELNSDAQSWTSIGNDPEIELGQSSGEVRLHFQHYVSNKIKISTVIKRQAAAAKRKQYRFELDDIEFQQRCTGVAGRIKRLLSPPVRNIINASFTMRVFQDRVAKLPEHLNVDLPTIVDMCDNNDVTDPDYIAMVEFIEPTIHLNPKKLHTELKDIYEGNRIVLKIDERTGTLRFKQANYTSAEIRNAASGYTQSKKGLNTDAIRKILTANGIDNQGERQDLEKKLNELLGEEKKKPEKQPLFMLDEASTKEEEGETKRQVVRRSRARKKEERLRRKQEMLEQKQREEEIMHALEQEEKLRQEEAEIARKKQEDDDRIERERQQQEVEAEKAAEKLRQEQAEIARKKQEDDDRIERERQQQQAEAEEAAEKLRKEQAEITRKKQEDDDRIERERQQQAIKQVDQLSQSDRNYIKYVFDWYDKEPKDGRIELTELKDALSTAGYDASAAEQMLNEYDKDGNGNLDYDEFEMWCVVTNAVESWKKSNADFNQQTFEVENTSSEEESSEEEDSNLDNANATPSRQDMLHALVDRNNDEDLIDDDRTDSEIKQQYEQFLAEEVKRDAEEEDALSTMTLSDLRKYAAKLNKKKKKTVQGYSKFRKGDEKDLADLIRTAESKMSIVPPGELSEMLNNMTDDWASSDEELNFAMDSENEDMEFAASSAVDTDDSDLDFAESSDKKTSSGLEFAESSHTSSGLEFAASSAVDSDKSEDFAVSSSVETDSDLDFAESSGKTSSGLDFAESSAVESD